MSDIRFYAIVDINWLPLPASLHYPVTRSFPTTGYREVDGPSELFSVYVTLLSDVQPGPGVVQSARIYPLVDEMRDRLPLVGTKFFLSTGTTVVAECMTQDRGEETTI